MGVREWKCSGLNKNVPHRLINWNVLVPTVCEGLGNMSLWVGFKVSKA